MRSRGVKCWGENEGFRRGVPDATLVTRDDPDERGDRIPFVDLGTNRDGVGVANSCALFADGRVKCWGLVADIWPNLYRGYASRVWAIAKYEATIPLRWATHFLPSRPTRQAVDLDERLIRTLTVRESLHRELESLRARGGRAIDANAIAQADVLEAMKELEPNAVEAVGDLDLDTTQANHESTHVARRSNQLDELDRRRRRVAPATLHALPASSPPAWAT